VNKYNAQSIECDGIHFDSQKEYRRYQELLLLEKAGQITGIVVHPSFILLDSFTWRGQLIRAITYSPDFAYTEKGVNVIEEVKGGKATRTQAFEIRRKLFLNRYPEYDYRIV